MVSPPLDSGSDHVTEIIDGEVEPRNTLVGALGVCEGLSELGDERTVGP